MIVSLTYRKEAEVNMEGHFLVRQIYDDEVTYNIVGAAERVLSKFLLQSRKYCMLIKIYDFLVRRGAGQHPIGEIR